MTQTAPDSARNFLEGGNVDWSGDFGGPGVPEAAVFSVAPCTFRVIPAVCTEAA
ncbi:MAG TPA: hypothetical protein VK524_18480 [Polyangiaceae bacterium]|nr:hypothetical protein [Polyangiaceae bacterium]